MTFPNSKNSNLCLTFIIQNFNDHSSCHSRLKSCTHELVYFLNKLYLFHEIWNLLILKLFYHDTIVVCIICGFLRRGIIRIGVAKISFLTILWYFVRWIHSGTIQFHTRDLFLIYIYIWDSLHKKKKNRKNKKKQVRRRDTIVSLQFVIFLKCALKIYSRVAYWQILKIKGKRWGNSPKPYLNNMFEMSCADDRDESGMGYCRRSTYTKRI